MPVARKPRTTLAPMSVRERRMRSGTTGCATRVSTATKAAEQGRGAAEAERVRRAPAVLGRGDDGVDREHGGERDEQRAGHIEARAQPDAGPFLEEAGAERDDHGADGEVDEEDPVPVDRLETMTPPSSRPSEPPAVTTNMYALIAFTRSTGWGKSVTIRAMITRGDRAADVLHEAGGDQHELVVGEAAYGRRRR